LRGKNFTRKTQPEINVKQLFRTIQGHAFGDHRKAIMMAMVDVVSQLSTGGPMAQVRGLGSRVGGRLALFCIHRVNRVYSALVVTSWT